MKWPIMFKQEFFRLLVPSTNEQNVFLSATIDSGPGVKGQCVYVD